MLNQLAAYAHRHGIAIEPGYCPKSVRWAIWLNNAGQLIDLRELKAGENGDFPKCPDLRQNEMIAGGITRSHFLIDSIEVVVLFGAERLNEAKRTKINAKHEYFIELLEKAAEDFPVLKTCAEFLKSPDNLADIQQRLAASKASATDKITFQVDSEFPVAASEWHDWWNKFRASLTEKSKSAASENQKRMRCFMSGEMTEPLKTHSKIKNLTAVGGQPSGCVLIGFDKEAFASYGFTQSENAAISEDAAAVYVNALNDLIQKSDGPIAGTLMIYWYKEDVAAEDDPLNWIKGLLGGSEEDEIEALQRAQRLVTGIVEGKRPELGTNTYYVAVISATGGRVMLRSWTEGSFVQLVESVTRWFEDFAIISRDGAGLAKDPKFYAILYSLVRKDLSELSPAFVADMWKAALTGLQIPYSALAIALQRIRVEIIDPDKLPNQARMGLIKAYHIRKARFYGGECRLKPLLNEDHPSAAYQAGRLMAVLAAIQWKAQGDVGAGIIQRYYAAASTTPALIIGRLIRLSQFHLNKLNKGLANWYERLIREISSKFGDGIPKVLDLEEQSLFALGYYQQMADLYSKKESVEVKEDQNNG
jgi:CRISPR-associated protein Csd1